MDKGRGCYFCKGVGFLIQRRPEQVRDWQRSLDVSPEAHRISLEQAQRSACRDLPSPISGDRLRALPGGVSVWDRVPDAGEEVDTHERGVGSVPSS